MSKAEARKAGFCQAKCNQGKVKGTVCVAMNKFYGVPDDECMNKREWPRWIEEMKQAAKYDTK